MLLRPRVKIKQFYSNHKQDWNLPNFGGLSKIDLLGIICDTQRGEALQFVNEVYEQRLELVNQLNNDLQKIEWWNYKYQGERLFSNNNRLFLFLAFTDSFDDGRLLKGKLANIEESVNELLDNLSDNSIHQIKYKYTKDRTRAGNYSARAISILITGSR